MPHKYIRYGACCSPLITPNKHNPNPLSGPYDNYSLQDSHVLPGLLHKAYLSSTTASPFVVWGSGKPVRQFIFSRLCPANVSSFCIASVLLLFSPSYFDQGLGAHHHLAHAARQLHRRHDRDPRRHGLRGPRRHFPALLHPSSIRVTRCNACAGEHREYRPRRRGARGRQPSS